jgi:hypothetical protein
VARQRLGRPARFPADARRDAGFELRRVQQGLDPDSDSEGRDGAKLLQVNQPRGSDLLRGRLHLFSIETLIDMLGRLGVQVRFVVKPTRRRKGA